VALGVECSSQKSAGLVHLQLQESVPIQHPFGELNDDYSHNDSSAISCIDFMFVGLVHFDDDELLETNSSPACRIGCRGNIRLARISATRAAYN